MATRQRAYALHLLVPFVAKGKALIITEASQPYACAARDLLVGLHCANGEQVLLNLFSQTIAEMSTWRACKVQVRPSSDLVVARNFSDGLQGLPYFHPTQSSAAVKTMMGNVWRQAAEGIAVRKGQTFVVPPGVDWNNPESYMCALPHAASEVFRLLPDLEVLVGFAKVGSDVVCVAMVPISKLDRLVEWGEEKHHVEQIKVLGVRSGQGVEIMLPMRTFPVPARLKGLIGFDRFKRGQGPFK